MWVGISAVGAFETADGGQTWATRNKGVRVDFEPGPTPEFGQCVHKIVRHEDAPGRLYMQNHGGWADWTGPGGPRQDIGVLRSDDYGQSWRSIAKGLPSDFGFPIVVHPKRPETVFIFPLVADGERIPPKGEARVWRSDDAGETWSPSASGLPDHFYAPVLRDAMAADNADQAGLYVGARDGSVFVSTDDGESWRQITAHLPDVLSVRAAVV